MLLTLYVNLAVYVCFIHRANFIQLQLYMKELTYEEIEQQKAYDIIALLSKYNISHYFL